MAVILVETYIKDPDEKLDYGFDWSNALGSDTISSSAWVVPVGITEASPSPSHNDTTTKIWLEGGTANTDYTLVNRITTAGTRIFEASFRVSVRDTA